MIPDLFTITPASDPGSTTQYAEHYTDAVAEECRWVERHADDCEPPDGCDCGHANLLVLACDVELSGDVVECRVEGGICYEQSHCTATVEVIERGIGWETARDTIQDAFEDWWSSCSDGRGGPDGIYLFVELVPGVGFGARAWTSIGTLHATQDVSEEWRRLETNTHPRPLNIYRYLFGCYPTAKSLLFLGDGKRARVLRRYLG